LAPGAATVSMLNAPATGEPTSELISFNHCWMIWTMPTASRKTRPRDWLALAAGRDRPKS
jgi:hypothetical protein